MKNPTDIRGALEGKLWFVHEQKMQEMLTILAAVDPATLSAIRAERMEAARPSSIPSTGKSGGNIAVIPVQGVISHRSSIFSYFFGGASIEDLTQQIRQAIADPSVSAIVMDVDSPGGDVDGVDELASEIYQARKQKPITAVSNCLMASAAYYLASQANEIIASPSSLTGSIGVYTTHMDYSGALNEAGIKVSMIKFGDNKGEGNPYEALTDPAREHLQDMVNTFGDQFEKAVGRGRGLKQDDVHKKFGQGRVFDAKKAVKLGMVDRVGTLDDALAKHGAARGSSMRRADVVDTWDGAQASVQAAATENTKRVDGEDLGKEAFAYRASDDHDDWKLPIKFSDDAKTKSHIRNAISRWGSTDMPDKDEKAKARTRIKSAAKAHEIEVDDDSLSGKTHACVYGCGAQIEDGAPCVACEEQMRSTVAKSGKADDGDACACDCDSCGDGDCGGCDCDGCDCVGCACDSATAKVKSRAEDAARAKSLAKMRHELSLL